jgi:hypothetical protein
MALEEFLIHGLRYAFPPERGEPTRGIPTSAAALPLAHASRDEPPVWPHPEGQAKGYGFSPLYRSAPEAALADPALYELLALVDAVRDARCRQRNLAARELTQRLKG